MDIIVTPLNNLFSEEFLKEKLKFYSKTTISKSIAEVELETLLEDKEYKYLIRTLYG